MEVGLKIKSFLQAHGIKQKHISNVTGITTAKLNQSLNGHRRLSFEEYVAICNALNVSVTEFLEARS